MPWWHSDFFILCMAHDTAVSLYKHSVLTGYTGISCVVWHSIMV